MRILVVEDSRRLRASLETALTRAGYSVDATGDGKEGLWYAQSNNYDAIVLDIMLPGMDGLSILEALRKGGGNAQVLLLTARDTVEDRVKGLDFGADDYLVKPFALQELLARLRALCRRSYHRKTALIEVSDLRIDLNRKTVIRGDAGIELQPREYQLLEYLALRRGEVVTRSEIEAHIYPDEADLMSNSVNSAICMLRKKLNVGSAEPLIQTRRGLGYVFELESECQSDPSINS